MALPPKVPAQVKSLKCTQCGAPLDVRDPYRTLSVVCASCGAVLDARHPDLAVLFQLARNVHVTPLIPPGKRGTWRGDAYECTGMIERQTVVEGVTYRWHEYLLFNPYQGYRWLVEQEGHWLYVRPCLSTPETVSSMGRSDARVDGTLFRCFQSSTATVSCVVGEFYWRIEQGDRAMLVDHVAPPHMLSEEVTAGEVNWSLGEYVDREEVRAAFRLGPLPEPRGIAPAQPNPFDAEMGPVGWLLLQFLAVALVLHIVFCAMADDRKVLSFHGEFAASDAEKSRVSPVFEIKGSTAPVEVIARSNVDNHWVFLGMALINEETNVGYDFGREISYYHGVDDGESWSEGATVDEVTLPAVPPGKYYLRVEPQADLPAGQYDVDVVHAPTQHYPFWLTAFLLVLPPMVLWLRRFSFEEKRWRESDYPIFKSSEE